MKKLLFICIVIIVVVTFMDILLRKKVFEDFDYMISVLEEIDARAMNQDSKSKVDNLKKNIDEKYLLFAFCIDHVELEKIKGQIVMIKAGMDESDESFLHEEIERTIFIIQHLKQKIDFKLENIL